MKRINSLKNAKISTKRLNFVFDGQDYGKIKFVFTSPWLCFRDIIMLKISTNNFFVKNYLVHYGTLLQNYVNGTIPGVHPIKLIFLRFPIFADNLERLLHLGKK